MNDLRGFAEGAARSQLGSDLSGFARLPLSYRAGGDFGGLPHALSIAGPLWRRITYPAAFALMAYGAGVFIAVPAGASQGTAYRSTDQGLTWQPVALGSTAGDWKQVLTNGNGVWIIIAGNSATSNTYVRSSDHGLTWQTLTMPVSVYWYSASFSNGKFNVQSNQDSVNAYSSDNALVWTALGTAGGSDNRIIMGDGRGALITKGASDTNFYYSEDYGKTWRSVSVANASPMYKCAFEKGLFLVPRYSTTTVPSGMYVSENRGRTWSLYPMPLGAARKWYDVTRLGNMLVSITPDGNEVALSVNGKDWYLAQNSLPIGNTGNSMCSGAGVILICNSSTTGSRGTVA